MAGLVKWLGGRRALFASWGDYDWNQLGREVAHAGIPWPFGKEHLNIKRRFSEVLGDPKKFGMAGALARVGLPMQGTAHRGIDDARNIARLLPWALGRAGEARG